MTPTPPLSTDPPNERRGLPPPPGFWTIVTEEPLLRPPPQPPPHLYLVAALEAPGINSTLIIVKGSELQVETYADWHRIAYRVVRATTSREYIEAISAAKFKRPGVAR